MVNDGVPPLGDVIGAFKSLTTVEYVRGVKTKSWSGEVELRGLRAGASHVVDYETGKDMGVVNASNARLKVSFDEHLLLEASPQ